MFETLARENFFYQKIDIDIEVGSFRIRTLKSMRDVEQLLKCRESCFLDKKFEYSFFEAQADHLVVEDKTSGRIVGGYRLTSSHTSSDFESEEDFDVKDWVNSQGGVKIELAWAWTHPNHRTGEVILYLWKGLSVYFKKSRARFVFGPATVYVKGGGSINGIYSYLKKNKFLSQKLVSTKIQTNLSSVYEPNIRKITRKELPALLRAYLVAGALVCSMPSFDSSANSFDFLTVLELENSTGFVKDHFHFGKEEI